MNFIGKIGGGEKNTYTSIAAFNSSSSLLAVSYSK
jgi:hypothetical protein